MTSTAHTATLHGHELSYLDSGEGPAVLFIHGLLGSHRNWAHLIDALNTDHRVVAPDLFGHGASAKPMGDYSLGSHAATLGEAPDAVQRGQLDNLGRLPAERQVHLEGIDDLVLGSLGHRQRGDEAAPSAGRGANLEVAVHLSR